MNSSNTTKKYHYCGCINLEHPNPCCCCCTLSCPLLWWSKIYNDKSKKDTWIQLIPCSFNPTGGPRNCCQCQKAWNVCTDQCCHDWKCDCGRSPRSINLPFVNSTEMKSEPIALQIDRGAMRL